MIGQWEDREERSQGAERVIEWDRVEVGGVSAWKTRQREIAADGLEPAKHLEGIACTYDSLCMHV